MDTSSAIPDRHPLRVFTEARLHHGPGAGIYAIDAASGDATWRPYSDIVGPIELAARVGPPEVDAVIPLGDVDVRGLPYFHGPAQLLRCLPRLVPSLWRAAGGAKLCMIRLPGVIGLGAGVAARLRRRPYAVEVLGDPMTLLRSGAAGRLGFVLAPLAGAVMAWVVTGAVGGRYVTRRALQQQYPLAAGRPSHTYSTVRLDSDDYRLDPRRYSTPIRRVITIGNQDQPYKGHDDLIRAVALLRESGREIELTLVGDGHCQEQLRRLATDCGVSDLVDFAGRVNDRGRLRELLDSADLYVQPSRSEGLPRALIEAMARGLPAIGTDVGGIGELLASDRLVPAARPDRLAAAILRFGNAPDQLSEAATQNLTAARRYSVESQSVRVADWMAFLRRTRAEEASASVAHVFGAMDRGGAELRTIELARRVPAVRHTYVTLSGRRGELADDIEREGGAVRPCRLSLSWPLAFRRLIRQERVEVVVSNVATFSGVVLLVARWAGVNRRVAYLRSDGDQHGNGVRRRAQRTLMRRLIDRYATDVVGNAPGPLRFALGPDREPDRRAAVVPDGVDSGPAPDHDGPHVGPLAVVHVARTLASKRRPRALEILAAARSSGLNARLTMVGSVTSEERHQLEQLADDLGVAASVDFVGVVEDVAAIMRRADVLLVTSTREGLPGVVLEALASGCPVVATTLPGTQYIAAHCVGITLVDTDADDAWVSALRGAGDAGSSIRTQIWDCFRTSPFAMTNAVERVSGLWQPR